MGLLFVTHFSFFQVIFQLKNLRGSIVNNTILSFTTELMGNMSSCFFLKSLGTKNAFAIGYGIALLGAILFYLNWDKIDLIPVFLVI